MCEAIVNYSALTKEDATRDLERSRGGEGTNPTLANWQQTSLRACYCCGSTSRRSHTLEGGMRFDIKISDDDTKCLTPCTTRRHDTSKLMRMIGEDDTSHKRMTEDDTSLTWGVKLIRCRRDESRQTFPRPRIQSSRTGLRRSSPHEGDGMGSPHEGDDLGVNREHATRRHHRRDT